MRSEKGKVNNELNKENLLNAERLGSDKLLKIKKRLRRGIIISEDLSPLIRSKIEWEAIDSFDPEVVYTIGGSVRALKLAEACSVRYKIPIVVHFMDDWPNSLKYRKGADEALYSYRLMKHLRDTLKLSKCGLGISPFMAAEYEKQYDIPFSWAGCVADNAFSCGTVGKYKDLENALVYAGGLHLGRWRSLLQIEKALVQYAPDYHLVIYTSEANRRLFEDSFKEPTVFCNSIEHDKLPDVYASAACLIYVEDTEDPYHEAYCRLSISTKLPECLISGRPLLFYGPSSLGVFKMLRDNNLAATASSSEELREALQFALSGKIDTDAAAEYSNRFFSAKANLDRLTSALQTAICENRSTT